jgi:YVTN family beta-propeller protein
MSDEECEKKVADKAKDGIAMIDTASHKLLRVLPGGSDPEQFDITPDGRTLIVSNEDAGKASFVDIESGKVVRQIAVGGEPEGVRVAPDGRQVLVTSEEESSVAVIDTAAGTANCRVKVGLRPRDIVFIEPTRAFVSSETGGEVALIDTKSCSVVRTSKLPPPARPMGLALSPDHKTLYVANGRAKTVTEVDVASGAVGRSVEAGTRPWGIVVSRDGKKLFTANGPSNDVSVIDVDSFKVAARIPAGKSPWGIAAAPAGK